MQTYLYCHDTEGKPSSIIYTGQMRELRSIAVSFRGLESKHFAFLWVARVNSYKLASVSNNERTAWKIRCVHFLTGS
jgi:hypothetical protein